MEVDDAQCGGINLNSISDEDREMILKVISISKVSLKEFGDYLDAARFNHSEWPLKDQIKDAQTELNKNLHSARQDNQQAIRRKRKVNHSFETITQKLCDYKTRGRGLPESDNNFEGRADIDKTVKSWNTDNVAAVEGRYSRNPHFEFVHHNSFKAYDHWNLSATKRTECLNKQFEEFVAVLKEEMGISEFSELGKTTADTLTIVGRLANTDSDVEFKSNIELINLSEENESGLSKVKLNLDDVQGTATLFEGQIVVVKGTSEHETFNVSSIEPLPIPKAVKETATMDDGGLSVFVFGGPYTFSDSLNYSLLKYITHLIRQQEPHLAILTGPFVDINHEFIKEGELFYTDDEGKTECFEDLDIYKAIKEYLDNEVKDLQTKIIIIPSLNDMVSMHPFPQPPLSKNSTEKVSFLPNPSRFSIGGVEFGLINTDVIRQTLAKLYLKNGTKHRLHHAVEEILKQRSFFPLHPPKEETSIDISQYKLYEMPQAPDVLITMSELPVFTDCIEGKTVFLNPGLTTKNNQRGTYGVVTINADGNIQDLKSKIRVDIKNI